MGGADRATAAVQWGEMTTAPLVGAPGAGFPVDDVDLSADGSARPAPLSSLAPLLRDEPGLTRALADPSARLAVV